MPKDIMFFMSRIVPLSFSSRLAVVLPCSLTITNCEECDDHFFFIQKRVHIIAWTWCHFLHVRSMAWTGRMFQMKMQIFCAQAKKGKQKTFFSERFFISSWKTSVAHKKASMRNEGQGERNKCQDQGQYANFFVHVHKKASTRNKWHHTWIANFFHRAERFHVTRKMSNAQTQCGKFIDIAFESFFLVALSDTNCPFFLLLKIGYV